MQFTPGLIPANYSNEVYITLPRYSTIWSFRKSSILNTFPESLLGLALAQDSNAEGNTYR